MQQKTRVRDVRDWSGIHAWSGVPIAAGIAWFLFWRDPAESARRECARRYAAAATAADTLRIDAQAAGRGTKGGAWNCGMLRRAP